LTHRGATLQLPHYHQQGLLIVHNSVRVALGVATLSVIPA